MRVWKISTVLCLKTVLEGFNMHSFQTSSIRIKLRTYDVIFKMLLLQYNQTD